MYSNIVIQFFFPLLIKCCIALSKVFIFKLFMGVFTVIIERYTEVRTHAFVSIVCKLNLYSTFSSFVAQTKIGAHAVWFLSSSHRNTQSAAIINEICPIFCVHTILVERLSK